MVFISKVSPVVVFQTMAVMTLSFPFRSSTLLPETATYWLDPLPSAAVYRDAVPAEMVLPSSVRINLLVLSL